MARYVVEISDPIVGHAKWVRAGQVLMKFLDQFDSTDDAWNQCDRHATFLPQVVNGRSDFRIIDTRDRNKVIERNPEPEPEPEPAATCETCNKSFRGPRGLRTHKRHCLSV